jgi:V8-like Glu-specific endopeptidase
VADANRSSGAENMIVDGRDTRTIQFGLDVAPHTAIALVQTFYQDHPNIVGYGTAFLIGPGRLATAAHLFWNDLDGHVVAPRMPDVVKLFIGEGLFQGHPELAFEIDDPAAAIRVHPDFKAGAATADMATIDLADAPRAALPLLPFPANLSAGERLTISGYPVDLAPFGDYEGFGPLADLNAPVFEHQVDTAQGQSGAPVRVQRVGAWQAIGIHLGDGDAGPDGAARNRALALTPDVISWLHGP